MVMEPHLRFVKDRHDRAVDYLNNGDKRRRIRRYLIAGAIVVLFALIEFLT